MILELENIRFQIGRKIEKLYSFDNLNTLSENQLKSDDLNGVNT